MSDLVILNTRPSRVSLIDLVCLPSERKHDEAAGGMVTVPSRTACTQAQAEAIKAHRPSMKLFEAKVLKWGKAETVKVEPQESKQPDAKAEPKR